MYIGRIPTRYIAALVGLGVVAFALLVLVGMAFPDYVRVDTWMSRLNDFVSNNEGSFQQQQAKIAIAKGGWTGLGPGNSFQRNYIPHPYSDLIFAIVAEEYGIFVALGLLATYLFLFIRCIKIVMRSPNAFGAMLAVGLGLMMTLQALLNFAVAVHLFPVTGLTLPFVSLGGTSLIFTFVGMGMILSVSKHIEQPENR